MRRIIVLGLAAASLAIAGCGGGDDDSDAGADAGAPETTTQADQSGSEPDSGGETADSKQKKERTGVGIKTGDSQFGAVLFGAGNQAIYLFDVDERNKSNCSGDCAAAWPPVLTKGEPQAKGEVDQKLLGTTKRDDGETQVTYNGHPLYYYVNEGPGEVRCSNVFLNGGNWYAVTPAGDRV